MIVEDIAYSIGSVHAGLTALIGSGSACRLYPVGKVNMPTLPAVIFTKGDEEPVEGVWADSGWFYTTITFEVLAASAREAALVMAQVRAAYKRYHGTVSTAKVDDITSDGNLTAYYDQELDCYVEELDFKFFHTE